MIKIRSIFLLFLLPIFLLAEDTATLIVTYRTDRKGERLDRTRFWIKKNGERLGFYPQGPFFVEDRKEMSRMVVIEGLQPGDYTLHFLVPNLDHYFQEPNVRKITLSQGEIFKIDQLIRTNKQQKNLPVSVAVEKKAAAPEEKNNGFGCLIVSYDCGSEEQNTPFRLIHSSGETSDHPDGNDLDIPLDSGKMVMIPQLRAGMYRLEFFTKNRGNIPVHSLSNIDITTDKTTSIHENVKF